MVRRLTAAGAPALCVALPAAIVGLLSAGFLVAASFGRHPMWAASSTNMSEAAALRDAATVMQLIRRGESPYERRPVRAGLLTDRPLTLTALEAAIVARRSEVIQVIVHEAGGLDLPTWTAGRCLAEHVADPEIVRTMDSHAPADVPDAIRRTGQVDCADVPLPWP